MPTVFFFILLAALYPVSLHRTVCVFVLSLLFGSTAVLTLPALGDAPLVPAVATLLLLAFLVARSEGTAVMLRAVAPGKPGFYLLLFAVWGIVSAAFLPRIFQGMTDVFVTNRFNIGASVMHMELQPVSGNYTQSAYAVLNLLCFVCAFRVAARAAHLKLFATLFLFLGLANAAAAVMNLVERYTGVPMLLAFIRNANYAILSDQEVFGLVRIAGTFTETSTFATFTISMLAFSLALWMGRYRPLLTSSVAALSALFLTISTSTTAYLAMFLYLCFALLGWLMAVLRTDESVRLGWLSVLSGTVVAALCVVWFVAPEWLSAAYDFIDVLVLRKMESSSGVERGSWNAQAFVNFKETFGVGIGLGSGRASSFALALLSNLGLIGAALFASFLVSTWLGSRNANNTAAAVFRTAAIHGMVSQLIARSLSGGTPDMGLMFFVFAGMVVASGVTTRADANDVEVIVDGREAGRAIYTLGSRGEQVIT